MEWRVDFVQSVICGQWTAVDVKLICVALKGVGYVVDTEELHCSDNPHYYRCHSLHRLFNRFNMSQVLQMSLNECRSSTAVVTPLKIHVHLKYATMLSNLIYTCKVCWTKFQVNNAFCVCIWFHTLYIDRLWDMSLNSNRFVKSNHTRVFMQQSTESPYSIRLTHSTSFCSIYYYGYHFQSRL